MKIIVDRMPSCEYDCPFYSEGWKDGTYCHNCKIDDCECAGPHDQSDGMTECRWLKELKENRR